MKFKDDYIDELYAIHRKYEEPMKMRKEISEKRNQVDYLNDEINKDTNEIKKLE